MDTIIFILFAMIFCHIFDDYVLQGCLANLKQKSWWDTNAPDKLYKKDYIMGLICHSCSWSFMIMLPIALYLNWSLSWMLIMYPVNMIVHCIVDDLKANKKKINLIQDQIIHLIQIALTYFIFVMLSCVGKVI